MGAYRIISQLFGVNSTSQLREAFCPTRIVGPERRSKPVIGLPSALRMADATVGQPLIITASPSPPTCAPAASLVDEVLNSFLKDLQLNAFRANHQIAVMRMAKQVENTLSATKNAGLGQ
jgi:hypothetical protein